MKKNNKSIRFREPTKEDGKEMYRIVRESKVLDVNSEYSYLMWTKFFHKTSILATDGDKVIGFVSGFIPPEQNDTLFVWQVAVDSAYRGYGLATNMIHQLFQRVSKEKSVNYIEATVTPTNTPSQQLFQGIAAKNGTQCVISECFLEKDFSGKGHEEEEVFRIGPIFKK